MADWVEEQIVKHEWTGNVDNISYGQILVRCKDCKHNTGHCKGLYSAFVTCYKTGTPHKADWFCADGVRAGGDAD